MLVISNCGNLKNIKNRTLKISRIYWNFIFVFVKNFIPNLYLDGDGTSTSDVGAVEPQSEIVRPVEQVHDVERRVHGGRGAGDAVGRRPAGRVGVVGGRQSHGGRAAVAVRERGGGGAARERRRVVVDVDDVDRQPDDAEVIDWADGNVDADDADVEGTAQLLAVQTGGGPNDAGGRVDVEQTARCRRALSHHGKTQPIDDRRIVVVQRRQIGVGLRVSDERSDRPFLSDVVRQFYDDCATAVRRQRPAQTTDDDSQLSVKLSATNNHLAAVSASSECRRKTDRPTDRLPFPRSTFRLVSAKSDETGSCSGRVQLRRPFSLSASIHYSYTPARH